MHPLDITGRTYGRLTVVGMSEQKGKNRVTYWICRCSCGTECEVAKSELSSGGTQSCGCLRLETVRAKNHARGIPESQHSAFNQIYRMYEANSRRRKLPFDLSYDDFARLITLPCHYCGMEPSQQVKSRNGIVKTFLYNGIDRIDNNAGYVAGNCLPCCGQCNFARRNLTYEEFQSWLERLCRHRGLAYVASPACHARPGGQVGGGTP